MMGLRACFHRFQARPNAPNVGAVAAFTVSFLFRRWECIRTPRISRFVEGGESPVLDAAWAAVLTGEQAVTE